MLLVELCPGCLTRSRRTDTDECLNCAEIGEFIEARRAPMDRATRRLTRSTLGLAVVVAVLHAAASAFRYISLRDPIPGEHYYEATVHATAVETYGSLGLMVAADMLFSVRMRSWIDLGHANAMARPEMGLRWQHGLPSARFWERTRWVAAVVAPAMIVAAMAFAPFGTHQVQDRIDTALQIMLSVAYVLAYALVSFSTRRMETELVGTLNALEADDAAREVAAGVS